MYLGLQSQKLTREGVEFAVRADARTVKIIGPGAHNVPLLQELRARLPKCEFVYRHYFAEQRLNNPIVEAGNVAASLAIGSLGFDYEWYESYNETGYFRPEADYYSELTVELAGFLHAKGQKLLAYSFGVTWPDVAILDSYAPGLAAADGLALHGYKLPHNADENTIYHHRQVRAALPADLRHKPIWYSEFGLDKGGDKGDGWSGPTWQWWPENYGLWLDMMAKELPDVEHGIVFLGEETDPKWRSWRIVGHDVIADAMAQANKAEDKRREGIMPNEFHIEGTIPASNYGDRDGTAIDTIVIHSTRGGATTPEAELTATINWFKSPTSQVSAHLVIAANGDYWYCVPWDKAAYHAKTHNKRSIGIELVQATPTTPFTDAQYTRLNIALDWLMGAFHITPKRGVPGIVGHEAIDAQKSDPGALFDWSRLGLGAASPPADMTAADKLAAMRDDLKAILLKYQ